MMEVGGGPAAPEPLGGSRLWQGDSRVPQAEAAGNGRPRAPVHVRSHSPNPTHQTLSVELWPLGSKAHGAALGAARSVTCSRRLWQSHTKAVHAR